MDVWCGKGLEKMCALEDNTEGNQTNGKKPSRSGHMGPFLRREPGSASRDDVKCAALERKIV